MDERLQFILDAQSDRFTMAELCPHKIRPVLTGLLPH
jgi:hypothetical protein